MIFSFACIPFIFEVASVYRYNLTALRWLLRNSREMCIKLSKNLQLELTFAALCKYESCD